MLAGIGPVKPFWLKDLIAHAAAPKTSLTRSRPLALRRI
jgi:hypothetical protein